MNARANQKLLDSADHASQPRAASGIQLPQTMKPLAIGLAIAALIALASTHRGAWLLIGCVAAAFLILGPGLTLWQRTRKHS